MSSEQSLTELVPFAQRVKKQENERIERTLADLKRENAELRKKYHTALLLLREYKNRAEMAAALTSEPTQQFYREKGASVWKDRLLRMHSVSPRKEPQRRSEEKPVEVLELAEALNSGEIKLDIHHVDQEDISEILCFRSS